MTAVETEPSGAMSIWQTRWRLAQTRLASVGDQVIVALTNFGLTLTIGRAFAAEEFAAYGLGISIALMIQGIQRHAITIPLMLAPSARAAHRARAVVAEQIIALLMAIGASALCLLVASVAGIGRYGVLIVASSAVFLLVYFQLEFARAFFVKIGRPWLLLASAAWYCAVAATLSVSAFRHGVSYEGMLAVLAAAMVLHALAIVAMAGAPAILRGWVLFRRDMRRYGGWAAAATLTYTGYNHVPLLLLGALAAPRHAAAFVATRSLLQPLQILLRGFDIADKSRFADAGHGKAGVAGGVGKDVALRFTFRLAALYAVIAAVFGALIVAFADPILVLAYGDKFAGESVALVAWVPVYVALSVTMPLESLVYARNEFVRYFTVRGVASVIALAAAVPLIGRLDEVGAIAACGIGWCVAALGTAAVLWSRRAK
jgi:O-antigen/teichoic acid export membrane protein